MSPAPPPTVTFHVYSGSRASGYTTGWRRLNALLFEYTDGGGWQVETRRKPWTCGPGEGLVVLPHTEHKLTLPGPGCRSTFALINCRWRGLQPFGTTTGGQRVDAKTMKSLRSQIQQLDQLQGDGWREALLRQTLQIQCLLALELPWSGGGLLDPRLADLMGQVEADLAQPLSCDALAARAGISTPHLHDLFKQQVGVSPANWVTLQRVELAQHLLVTTDLSVSSIAEQCGFSCPFHFSRVFRRHTSQSPSGFRKSLRHSQ